VLLPPECSYYCYIRYKTWYNNLNPSSQTRWLL